MGDRSPKSKHRDQKQKNTAKAANVAVAKSKQDKHNRTSPTAAKGKK